MNIFFSFLSFALDRVDANLQRICLELNLQFHGPVFLENRRARDLRRNRIRNCIANARRRLRRSALPPSQPTPLQRHHNAVSQQQTRASQSTQDRAAVREADRLAHLQARRRQVEHPLSTAPGRHALQTLNSANMVPVHDVGSRDITCNFCGALRWSLERSTLCCGVAGRCSSIDPFPTPPAVIDSLWRSQDREGRLFRQHARLLCNELAFSSLTLQSGLPDSNTTDRDVPVIIQGKTYHRIGPLMPNENDRPSYAQLYVIDSQLQEVGQERIAAFRCPPNIPESDILILRNVLWRLRQVIRDVNPFARDFIAACEMTSLDEAQDTVFVINPDARPPGAHERVYNVPFTQLCVLTDEQPQPRDIVIRLRGGGLRFISDTHRSHDALHYVLLFPYGTDGFHLQRVDPRGRSITALDFYRFHLHIRLQQSDSLFYAGSLFHEYCCVSYAGVENQRLRYLRQNQQSIRADLYQNVLDAVHAHDLDGYLSNYFQCVTC